MHGHGCPNRMGRPPRGADGAASALRGRLPWIGRLLQTIVCLVFVATHALAADSTMRLRLVWGGGEGRAWQGEIALQQGRVEAPSPLGLAPDEPGSMWLDHGKLRFDARTPRDFDGVDLTVQGDPGDTLQVTIQPAGNPRGLKSIQIPLSELIAGGRDEALDDRQNRLQVRRAPGGCLEVESSRRLMVFSPGEGYEFTVRLNQPGAAEGTSLRVQMQLAASGTQDVLWSDAQTVQWTNSSGPWIWPVRMTVPEPEGVYDVQIAVTHDDLRSRIGLKRTIASRKMQLVVLDPRRESSGALSWEVETELDVSHPSWWQRVTNLQVPSVPNLQMPALQVPGLPWSPSGIWPKTAANAAKSVSGRVESQTQMHALGRLLQLPPLEPHRGPAWTAYSLSLSKLNQPHLLEVEYPSDVPQALLVSLVEVTASGAYVPIGVDTGFCVNEQASDRRPQWLKHRLLFWPRSSQCVVLLANPSAKHRATFGKLRVLTGTGRLPPASAERVEGGRPVLAYLEKPFYARTFSAVEEFDAWNQRGFESWSTFYHAGERWTEYLRFAGYTGAMISVASEGGALYDSPHLQPTPRYDGGTFLTEGHDPYRKDVLELLLRQFDRNGLQFVPAIDFSTPLPELEALLRENHPDAAGISPVGPDGAWPQRLSSGQAPRYNLLHPRVQQEMLRVVRELAWRCAAHPSFNGLALQLSARGYALLPADEWGMDDYTIAQFERATGVRVPEGRGGSIAARKTFLLSPQHQETWFTWRASVVHDFHAALAREVAAVQPSARLYLATSGLFDSPQARDRLRPSLKTQDVVGALLLELGLDLRQLKETPQIVFLPPGLESPLRSVGSRSVELQLEQSPAMASLQQFSPHRTALVYRGGEETELRMEGDQGHQRLALVPVATPSDDLARRLMAQAVSERDVTMLVAGGWQIPLGQEDATREFHTVLSQLPAEAFQTMPGVTQPVVVRTLSLSDRTYVYAVNDSSWPVRLQMYLTAPPQAQVLRLGGQVVVEELPRNEQGALWSVELRPYDLAGLCILAGRVTFHTPRVELDGGVADALNRWKEELSLRVAALRETPPRSDVLNGGFDMPASESGATAHWTLLPARGTSAMVDTERKFGGQASLRLQSNGPVAVLLSDEFAAPRTGRIAVSLRVRVADPARQPTLRLALEGEYQDKPYVRPTVLGSGGAPLDHHWGHFLFAVEDLPFEGLSPLRVRFELLGPGEAWVDSIEVSDLAFDETERKELSKLVTLAGIKLRKEQFGDCHRVLSGYWPRYLMAYVPPLDEITTAPTSRLPTASPTKPTEPPPPEPGWRDRFRRFLPDLGR